METIKERVFNELQQGNNNLLEWDKWNFNEELNSTYVFYAFLSTFFAVIISISVNLFLKEILSRKRLSWNLYV